VVREGDQAPDTPAGADFDLLTSVPMVNGAGNIAFMGSLKVGSGASQLTTNTASGRIAPARYRLSSVLELRLRAPPPA